MVRDTATTLWRLHQGGRWIECVVRILPVGIDVEIVDDGTPIFGQTFSTEDEALRFADEERKARES